jgi:putative oxidoreductase
MEHAKIISHYEVFASVVWRLLIGGLFLMAWVGKVADFSGTVGYMAFSGIPLPEIALVLTIVLEVVGWIALVAGYRVKLVAFLLAWFTGLATLAMHMDFSVAGQDMLFMKNLMIIGWLLVMSAIGWGKCSMDSRKK